jgi:hypothetical protein
MRVGAQLETVIEHRLAEGAVDGRGGDAGVTIDSDEITTAAGLFGRDDPPQYPAVGAVLDSGGLLMVAVQGKNGVGLHLQSFQAGVLINSLRIVYYRCLFSLPCFWAKRLQRVWDSNL